MLNSPLRSIAIALLAIAIPQIVFSQSPGELVKEAISEMDQGRFSEAEQLLYQAKDLDPQDIYIDYEIAFCKFLQEDYKAAVDAVKKVYEKPDASFQFYQLLGNSYDLWGKKSKAEKTYAQAMERFPGAAEIHLELGVKDVLEGKYDEAIAHWEQGIRVNPSYPSIYFKMSNLFAISSQAFWSLLYGEHFILLEPSSERTAMQSQLLYNMIWEMLETDDKGNYTLYVDPGMSVGNGAGSLSMIYPLQFSMVLVALMMEDKEQSLEKIYETRKSVLISWFEEDNYVKYPMQLMEYQKSVLDAGHFQAYSYWIFGAGNPDEFDAWLSANRTEWDAFIEWFNQHPIELNASNYFLHSNY
jgi:tetratricopeptide (TPR) repeat protein